MKYTLRLRCLSAFLACLSVCACATRPAVKQHSTYGVIDIHDSLYQNDYASCQNDFFVEKRSFLRPPATSVLGAALGVGTIGDRETIVSNMVELEQKARAEKRSVAGPMEHWLANHGQEPYPANRLLEKANSMINACLEQKGWTN